jgi:hypothetical protein
LDRCQADLASTPEGGTVTATEVRIPMPSGHLWLDAEEVDGCLRVVLQQIPLADLTITVTSEARNHTDGAVFDADFEGWIAQAVQPSVITCLVIDPVTGVVKESESLSDPEHLWGGILATTDVTHSTSRAHLSQLWYANVGFDPSWYPRNGGGCTRRRPTAWLRPASFRRSRSRVRSLASIWT